MVAEADKRRSGKLSQLLVLVTDDAADTIEAEVISRKTRVPVMVVGPSTHRKERQKERTTQRRGLRKGMGSDESLPPLPTEGEREATQKLLTLPAGSRPAREGEGC